MQYITSVDANVIKAIWVTVTLACREASKAWY